MARIVIIGGVAAGMSAAAKAKRMNPAHQVAVYTDEEQVSYSACSFPYFAQGVLDVLIKRTPEEFRQSGVELYLGHSVTGFDPDARTLTVAVPGGQTLTDSYDKLVIATGARPVRPPIPGIDLPCVHMVNCYEDIIGLTKTLRTGKVKSAVVVGGGFIGVEMADALLESGVQVSLLEMAPQLLTNLDGDMAALIETHYRDKGVNIFKGEAAAAIEMEDGRAKVATAEHTLHGDIVIVAVGLVPNSEIARDAGAALGVKNAIRVNDKMETSLPGVYAAGDCATTHHIVTGREVWIPLGTTANKQGRIAGENAGGGNAAFKGVLGTSIFKALDLEGSRTGLSAREAREAGFDVWETTTTSDTIVTMYPGGGQMTTRLVIERGTDRILGGQIVGSPKSGKRIDVIAAMIQGGHTIYDLSELDLAYAPPFAVPWDALLVTANAAISQKAKGEKAAAT